MPGLRVVEAHAVEQHQRLAEARAADGEIDLFERHGFEGPGDDHGVALLRHLLGESEYRCKREEKEESEVQTVLYIGLPAMMVSTMNWNDAAEDLLNRVLGQTPYPVREATETQLRGIAEGIAEDEGQQRVGVETVIAA